MREQLTPTELGDLFGLKRREVISKCMEFGIPIYNGRIDRMVFETHADLSEDRSHQTDASANKGQDGLWRCPVHGRLEPRRFDSDWPEGTGYPATNAERGVTAPCPVLGGDEEECCRQMTPAESDNHPAAEAKSPEGQETWVIAVDRHGRHLVGVGNEAGGCTYLGGQGPKMGGYELIEVSRAVPGQGQLESRVAELEALLGKTLAFVPGPSPMREDPEMALLNRIVAALDHKPQP